MAKLTSPVEKQIKASVGPQVENEPSPPARITHFIASNHSDLSISYDLLLAHSGPRQQPPGGGVINLLASLSTTGDKFIS